MGTTPYVDLLRDLTTAPLLAAEAPVGLNIERVAATHELDLGGRRIRSIDFVTPGT